MAMFYLDEQKKKIIALVFGLVIIIAAIIIILLALRHAPAKVVNTNSSNTATVNEVIKKQLQDLPPPTKNLTTENENNLGLKQFIFLFAERYGSYSSQNDFIGLKELKSISTTAMQKYLDQLITYSRTNSTVYEGVSTKALSASIKMSDNDRRAEAVVKTQRSKVVGDKESEVSYQDLLVRLIKSGNDWLIDYAKWQ